MKWILLGLLIFLVGCSVQEVVDDNDAAQDNSGVERDSIPVNDNPSGDNMVSGSGIGLAELQAHNSKDDCWVVYKGSVYDVTSFLPDHKGGSKAIDKHCGSLDFEDAFQKQHGNSKADLFMTVTTLEGEYIG